MANVLKKTFFLWALLTLGVCSLAAAEDNIALVSAGALFETSSVATPVWKPEYMGDGMFDTNHGWVGSLDDGELAVRLTFGVVRPVSRVVFYQAAFREAEENRFARPRELRLTFDGDITKEVFLKDMEGAPQELTFQPVNTAHLTVEILSVYTDAAKLPKLAGFQEIQVFAGGIPLNEEDPGAYRKPAPSEAVMPEPPPEVGKPAADPFQAPEPKPVPRKPSEITLPAAPPDTSKQPLPSAPAPAAGAPTLNLSGLDPDEQELLILLQQFMIKLETYMRKKHAKEKQ